MTLKVKKPAPPCRAATGSEFAKLPGYCNSDLATFPSLFQERIDPVEWLASRANVALSTARVHAELFGIGGAQ